jgi:hypothetical protein
VVVYEGDQLMVASTSTTALTGFTVPTAPFVAKTTYIVADGQCGLLAPNFCLSTTPTGGSGDTLSFTGRASSLTDGPDAFKGSDGCPWGFPDTCLWDTRTFDVSGTVSAGDTSATASVTSGNVGDGFDCLENEAQVLAVGPASSFATAGYVAAGTGLRNQGSGSIPISGIPAGTQVVKALLYWNVLNPTDPGNAMRINGHLLSGVSIGSNPDPCWGAGTSWAYRADVTSTVTSNGTYTLGGYPTGSTSGTSPWISPSPTPMMEGASLVVIFSRNILVLSARVLEAKNGQAATPMNVAAFGDPLFSKASDYTAVVDWGDATGSFRANVLPASNSECISLGATFIFKSCFDAQPQQPHVYAAPGVYRTMVTVQRRDGVVAHIIGAAEVSPTPAKSLSDHTFQVRTGVLTWRLPNNQWFGCTATVINSLSKNLIVTAAHCGVPQGRSQLWFAPGFNAGGGVCPYPVPPSTENGIPDLTKCPAGDVPYGVWAGGNVVQNPAWDKTFGRGLSNDQTFIELSGTHFGPGVCDVPSAQCPSPNLPGNPAVQQVENARLGKMAIGGDPMDFFYYELGSTTLPMPSVPPTGNPKNGITFTTFGYPIDLPAMDSSFSATSGETLQMPCSNSPADGDFLNDPSLNSFVGPPVPGYGIFGPCTYGAPIPPCPPVNAEGPVGASGSPFLTNSSGAPLDNAVAAVLQGTAACGDKDAYAGVPGLITALTYLEAENLTSFP